MTTMRPLALGLLALLSGCALFARKDKDEAAKPKVDPVVRLGLDALKKGNFAEAAEFFERARTEQPENKEVLTVHARLQRVAAHVPRAMGGEAITMTVRRGAIAYVEGSELALAVSSLRQAYNLDPKDAAVFALLNIVEKEAELEPTRWLEGPVRAGGLVESKLQAARQSIYDAQYPAAIARARDILELDPDNVTALEILGSGHYLLGQLPQAKAAWERALQIDPGNAVVKDYLGRIK